MNRKSILVLILAVCFFSVNLVYADTGSAPEQPRIGIISAMDTEIDLLLMNAEIDRTDHIGGIDFHVGTLGGKDVVIVRAGIGKVLAAAGTAALLNNYDIESLFFTGVAGGVGDETKVLDVVIASDLVQHDFGTIQSDGFLWRPGENGIGGYYPCDEKLIELAYESAVSVVGADHTFKGTIATGDQFVASESYVKELQDKFNAIACEMEGASVAAVCFQYEIPFVVIRAMSDKADGLAHETYENMVDIAADNSCKIIMKMLEALN